MNAETIAMPDALKETLIDVLTRSYRDLAESGGKCSIEDAFADVLNAFGAPADDISHRRYVYMALAFGLAARPTIAHYYPEDRTVDRILDVVRAWLEMGAPVPEGLIDALPDVTQIGKWQAADEAYNVFHACLRVLDFEFAREAVEDILYDAITGDAIVGSLTGQRKVFAWWGMEVVPAAYRNSLPRAFAMTS